MRHRHHGAGEACQKLLQPLDRLRVQVVGGLVQQQHVWPHQEHPAQRHATLLAARQVLDKRVPLGQAQGVCGDLHLLLGTPVTGGDDRLQPRLLGCQGIKICVGFGVRRVHVV